MSTQTRIISLYSKTKDYCFLTIRRVLSPIFLQNLILLPAAASNQTVLFQITFRTSILLKQWTFCFFNNRQ